MLNPAAAKIIPPGTLRLGFGCAWLTAGRDLNHSLRLVRSALDAGLTYFDTARLYGLGDSEGILGQVLAPLRHQVIITSKVGILPGRPTLGGRILRKAHQMAIKTVPSIGRRLPDPPMADFVYHAFSPDQMRASVETTLRELRTDYLDLLLLHECSLADLASGEVMEYARQLKQQGKIREFGLATLPEETMTILKTSERDLFAIQFANNLWDDTISKLPAHSAPLIGTHTVLADSFRGLVQRLNDQAELARQWERLTGVDPNNVRKLGQLFLAQALARNSDGVVLFSSSNPQNIAAGAQVAAGGVFDDAQIEGLVQAMSLAYPTKNAAKPTHAL